MARRVIVSGVVAVALLLGAGCGDDEVDAGAPSTTAPPGSAIPDGEPTVVGVVGRADPAAEPVLVDASDPYFEGMALLRGDPSILDEDGEVLGAADLADGATVAVWTEGPCAESYPVQCTVVAIEVSR